MDSLIAAAARALASGDTLGALQCVAVRDDAPALALRGIAMAQLGEYPRARELLRLATRRYGEREEVARARCEVAAAEVALAMRDLHGPAHTLATASAVLERHGEHANAQYARLIEVRRLLLLGRLQESGVALAGIETSRLPPMQLAIAELVEAELALRSLHTASATAALARSRAAAKTAGIAALLAEVDQAGTALALPAARCISAGLERMLRLHEVEALLNSDTLVVDACRHSLTLGAQRVSLARRPVLFALARALAAEWPGDAERVALITSVFNTRYVDESHRARLRVEIARLRALIAPLGNVVASARGYRLTTRAIYEVALLLPPIEGEQAALLALLSDGEAWSSSALALAIGVSQRNIQRALLALEAAGQVRSIGRGRTQRWLAPTLSGFATNLLLPSTITLA
jgi:DNA-binding transcriptional ArsR family regulator